MPSLTAPERETIVTSCDADDYVSIVTAQRSVLGILRRKAQRNPHLIEVTTGRFGSSPIAEFRIPVKRVSWGGIVKRGSSSPIVVPIRPETVLATKGFDAVESQTTIRTSDADDTVVIETSQRRVYNALHRKALVSDRLIEIDGHFRLAVTDASWGGLTKRMGTQRANAFTSLETPVVTDGLEQGTGAAA